MLIITKSFSYGHTTQSVSVLLLITALFVCFVVQRWWYRVFYLFIYLKQFLFSLLYRKVCYQSAPTQPAAFSDIIFHFHTAAGFSFFFFRNLFFWLLDEKAPPLALDVSGRRGGSWDLRHSQMPHPLLSAKPLSHSSKYYQDIHYNLFLYRQD